ncbi:Hypothetical predicted protein [Marmota monax]|uniref:D(3) dopamine receptor n=1 Tax=Marmota monax TaxID=9995 RepID=A0A5E4CE83_MARMO|nr:hypothetical protein GHT09_010168 [Marmota monax]VTJ79590.1 Hypothetical predicted protein [Marmota monax]
MAPLNHLSGYMNSTCGAENSTGANRARPHAYYALSYCALILVIVFGNGLVCVAVLKERALKTTTNYLVVSLAVADLLVATLVMPWVVYLEVTGGVWNFSRICCDIFVTLDVMMCTASILNLCAISIDRYTAVVMPVHYQHGTGQSSCRRVALMITAVWVLAFAVSCPLLFGFNTTGDPSVCSISNPDFVIYSSVVSFYVPFGVTVLVYARIYVVLRQRRRKRILTRQNSQCISVRPSFPRQVSTLEGAEGGNINPGLPACPATWETEIWYHLPTHWYYLCFEGSKFNLKRALTGSARTHFLGKIIGEFLAPSASLQSLLFPLKGQQFRCPIRIKDLFYILFCCFWLQGWDGVGFQSLVWHLYNALLVGSQNQLFVQITQSKNHWGLLKSFFLPDLPKALTNWWNDLGLSRL